MLKLDFIRTGIVNQRILRYDTEVKRRRIDASGLNELPGGR